MATLNWLPREGGFAFAFSRAPSSGDAGPGAPLRVSLPDPATRELTRVLAPLDALGVGSRLSVNEYGLGLCLLEGGPARAAETPSAAPASSRQPPGAGRRAALLLELSGCRSEVALCAHLFSSVALEAYRPFVLGVFSAGSTPTFFEWDGVGLRQRLATRSPLTSAFTARGTVVGRRFRPPPAWDPRRRAPQTLDQLLRLHGRLAPGHRGLAPTGEAGAAEAELWLVVVDTAGARLESFRGFPAARASSSVHSLPLAPAAIDGVRGVPRLQAPPRTFDVPSLFAERGRGAYARLPPWALRAIAHAVGQQAVNRFLFGLGPMPAEAFPEACLRQLGVEVHVQHSLPCRLEGPPVYVANHPLGGVDGLALLALSLRRHGRTKAPVNALLTLIPHLAQLCVPLDPERDPRSLPATLRRVFQSDQPIALFPAGSASRRSQGVLADGPWGPMVASYCLRYRRPVIPVFISGHNSAKFYATAFTRKRLRVGINLEMFLLPREALSPVVRRLEMRVGQPVPHEELATMGATNLERVSALRERCYRLGDAL